jgi:hypothetical protein
MLTLGQAARLARRVILSPLGQQILRQISKLPLVPPMAPPSRPPSRPETLGPASPHPRSAAVMRPCLRCEADGSCPTQGRTGTDPHGHSQRLACQGSDGLRQRASAWAKHASSVRAPFATPRPRRVVPGANGSDGEPCRGARTGARSPPTIRPCASHPDPGSRAGLGAARDPARAWGGLDGIRDHGCVIN